MRYDGHLTLPILDPDDVTLADLRDEALHAWEATLKQHGFVPVGNVTTEVRNGQHPTITVRSVVQLARPLVEVPIRLVST